MFKRFKSAILALVAVLATMAIMVGCVPKSRPSVDYTIPMIDLSNENIYGEEYESLFNFINIDDELDYMAHPDAVELKSGKLMIFYPEGHGQGAIRTQESTDDGRTWTRKTNTPKSWDNSKETPTVYRLQFNDNSEKIVLISAVPTWYDGDGKVSNVANGFNASYSEDDGETWTEFENYYGKDSDYYLKPIVAMASLTRLKDSQGNWRDAWMGLFHDNNFYNYKTILTFDENGMNWSKPEKYFKQYRSIEKATNMCEVETIRSGGGQGNELCIITRSNTKQYNSLVSFSTDEGESWSKPVELPPSINGERFSAHYLDDGRLYITFRSIERQRGKILEYGGTNKDRFVSDGWVAWVGNYDDLKEGKEGQYRIKIAHTYLDNQQKVEKSAHPDTGYCGNVILNGGTIFTSSYGKFDKDKRYLDGNGKSIAKTSIVAKRLDINLIDQLVARHN